MTRKIVPALLLAACGLQADIVTNDYFGNITSPTTLSGVTNIIAKTQDVNISADLTLDNKTFLWLKGDTGAGNIVFAPTANDVTLTVKGNSAFYATYRNSCDGSNVNSTWGKVGIDPLNKYEVAGCYNVRFGVYNGTPGSTGRVKIVPLTVPDFGYNAKSPFWARYLYIESSVSPDPKTGMIDFLEIPTDVTVDISHVVHRSTAYPARIKFNGGTFRRNNACRAGNSNLAPQTGTSLILEGVNGQDVWLRSQFIDPNQLTQRAGGSVRFVGNNVKLQYTGNTPSGSGRNHYPLKLSSADNVSWEHTGKLILAENIWLQTESDDVLPQGSTTGGIEFSYNSNVGETSARTTVSYACLDLYGTRQKVNGVSSSSTAWHRIGVITNTHATAEGTLVLGTGNLNGQFTAKATANVVIEKVGSGMLAVQNATGERLDVKAGIATFSGTSVFTNVNVSAGTTLSGSVGIGASFVAAANVDGRSLNVALGSAATVDVGAGNTLTLFTVSRDGTAIPSGTYTAETTDWVTSGTVVVLWRADDTVADISWTGEGTTDSASLAANWSDGLGAFTEMRGRPVFATGGMQAVLDSGVSSFMGLKFDASGDFTVITNGPQDSVIIYGSIDVALPDDNTDTRNYTLSAPMTLNANQTITLQTNVTVQLLGSSSTHSNYGYTFAGKKTGTGTYEYDDAGRFVLENARVSGPIVHKLGGGWMVLRGDVGNPGDSTALELDYARYRNGKDKTGGILNGALTRLENATIWKPVTITGQGQVGGLSDRWFVGGEGTTNIFKELVTCGPSTAINAERNAVMIFEKGVYVTGGAFQPKASSGTPTFIFNGPVKLDSTSRQLVPNSTSRLVFNSAGNYSVSASRRVPPCPPSMSKTPLTIRVSSWMPTAHVLKSARRIRSSPG